LLAQLFGGTPVQNKVSDIATVLDEAFAYLLIEIYWDEWSTKN